MKTKTKKKTARLSKDSARAEQFRKSLRDVINSHDFMTRRNIILNLKHSAMSPEEMELATQLELTHEPLQINTIISEFLK